MCELLGERKIFRFGDYEVVFLSKPLFYLKIPNVFHTFAKIPNLPIAQMPSLLHFLDFAF